MQREEEKKALNEASKSTFEIGIYTIYDTVLKQFEAPISIPTNKLYDYMSLLVNDVQSRFYGHESDYIVNKIGVFNSDTGKVDLHFVERVSILDSYIDKDKRRLQEVLQVLNYLPSGYFKMPVEQKQVIQEKIDNAVTEYIANYVLPDLDVSRFDTNKVRDIYANYDKYTSS